jgi:hypothetical protein
LRLRIVEQPSPLISRCLLLVITNVERPAEKACLGCSPSAAQLSYWVPLLDASQRRQIELSLVAGVVMLVLVLCLAGRSEQSHQPPGQRHRYSVHPLRKADARLLLFLQLRSRVVNPLIEPVPCWQLAADVAPSDETLQACRSHAVQVASRKGVATDHRASWPPRTRCKEGNLACIYDHYRYERDDIIGQLGAVHVAAPDYFRQIIKPFGDPLVGDVEAPSICDNNTKRSWMARGRLYAEITLHGPLQCGYKDG